MIDWLNKLENHVLAGCMTIVMFVWAVMLFRIAFWVAFHR